MSSAASESFAERSLTPSLENYLKIIFREEQEGGSAHASAIADAAGEDALSGRNFWILKINKRILNLPLNENGL